MTAVTAPYTLSRRAGGIGQSLAPPPPVERRAGLLREDVRRIIAERHFSLAFQPVVRLSDRRVVSHEALLRLHPPAGLPTPPTRAFVGIAGGWELAAALDAAVLDMALTAWARSGATPVAINVAASSVQDQDFVAAAVARIGGEGAALLVEVAAGAGIDDIAALAAGVAALQAVGVRVCLDDLGGEAATLECMRAMRFDQVKIAGAAVHAAAAGERGRRLVAALVALAGAAGAETVAKLIETLPQAWLMQELRVRHGQGWLFGPPAKLVD